MEHRICRVTALRLVGEYKIDVAFDDGARQEIDFEPVLAGEVYGPLRDPALFAGVRIDPEAHTLVWPNGADFDPATLYDWPKYAADLALRASRWSLNPA